MPIYEFYCLDCHTVFNFFSSRIDTAASPACPRCERAGLQRKPSRFATFSQTTNSDTDDDPMDGLDESRLEGAMESLMHEMGGMENEEDPRAMGHMMRRFSELSGLEMGDRMEELIVRMEAGEDPESLEQEMGGELDGEGAADFFKLKKAAARRRRPKIDDELFFL